MLDIVGFDEKAVPARYMREQCVRNGCDSVKYVFGWSLLGPSTRSTVESDMKRIVLRPLQDGDQVRDLARRFYEKDS